MRIERKEFPWERFFDLNVQEIGELIRSPELGKKIHGYVHKFPKLKVNVSVLPITRSVLRVDLTMTADYEWDEKVHTLSEPFWIVVEDSDGERILHYESFVLKGKYAADEQFATFTVPLFDPLPPCYFVKVVSDRWIASKVVIPISFRHLFLPRKNLPPTELLDLKPLPVSVLKNDAYVGALFGDRFSVFNSIQTQTFSAAFGSDDNLFVGAPNGSGKTVIAELALARLFLQGASDHPRKAVYVSPFLPVCNIRLAEWQLRFTERLGKEVILLTGESAHDLPVMEREEDTIIIATPERWDKLSRRWKIRPSVGNIDLFILDDAHCIGAEDGHVMEVVGSRVRVISSSRSSGVPIRIVALAVPIADAQDIGEWLGCNAQHSFFNFPPNSRPVPLEVHLRGIDFADAMLQPVVASTRLQAAEGKSTIVFVPPKQSRLVAQRLCACCESEDDAARFLGSGVRPEDMLEHCSRIDWGGSGGENDASKELQHGIACVHESVSVASQRDLIGLFYRNVIRVLVCPYNVCWQLSSTDSVVVMGTQFWDGREHRYVDYPLFDILHMMGLSMRGTCTVICPSSRKEFLKKFIFEPLPVESHLDHFLADHFNAEISAKVIVNKENAIDYLTWTFFYRRLQPNPNYYNLHGTTTLHVSEHLSELVENTVEDLERSHCIGVVNDLDLEALNLGIISAYYNIHYLTVDVFGSSLTATTRLRGLLEILSNAAEFDNLPIRKGEESILRDLGIHFPLKISNPKWSDPHTKVNILLQAHFSRHRLPADLDGDRREVVCATVNLLSAMVDILASNEWLSPALAAMELCQMIVQGMWDSDSPLIQLPHVTRDMAKFLSQNLHVGSIFDLGSMADDARAEAFRHLAEDEVRDIAVVCNAYPNVDFRFALVETADGIKAGSPVALSISIQREADASADGSLSLQRVSAPFYPAERIEGWWVVVGMKGMNQLLAIKRLTLLQRLQLNLEFAAPSTPGKYAIHLYLMSDSHVGCDQEYELELVVKALEYDAERKELPDGDAAMKGEEPQP